MRISWRDAHHLGRGNSYGVFYVIDQKVEVTGWNGMREMNVGVRYAFIMRDSCAKTNTPLNRTTNFRTLSYSAKYDPTSASGLIAMSNFQG